MAKYRAIDLMVLPFTHEVKAGPYQAPKGEKVRDSLVKLGVWDQSYSPSELIDLMDAAGIEKALIPAHAGDSWKVPSEVVEALVGHYPDRLYGMVGVDTEDIMTGVRELEDAVRNRGFVGARCYPHWLRVSPDDRVLYPFYAKCIELDVPIQIQVGLAFQTRRRSVGRPGAIDSIAVDFPELKIVAIHTGYPWEREMVAVAWKHPNVFIGADTWHPSNWAPELIMFIKGVGREKTMFGTNYPCLEFAEALAGVEALGLDEETKELLLRGNARRIYRLDETRM